PIVMADFHLPRLFQCLTPTHTLHLPLFYTHPPPSEIPTLSLHDALPIWNTGHRHPSHHHSYIDEHVKQQQRRHPHTDIQASPVRDRKSTRLNSSHDQISYAVFCLKKKKKNNINTYHEHNKT